MIKTLNKRLQSFIDTSFLVSYLIKFIIFYFLCRFLFTVWWGVSDPNGLVYSAFCEQYMNYYTVTRFYMFQLPISVTGLLGIHAFQDSVNSLQVENGGRLLVKDVCYGLGLISFWIAFVLSDSTAWKRKVMWCLAGVASLMAINIMRVSLLLAAKQNQWNIHLLDSYGLDHHTLFNIVAYAFIFLLMLAYYKKNKEGVELKMKL